MSNSHWTHAVVVLHAGSMQPDIATTRWSAAREALAARRARAATRRRLTAEMAAYRTPAERADLNATLDLHPDQAETVALRALLNRVA